MAFELRVDFKDISSDFEFNIDLENANITIRLIYNTRVDYWFANFSTDINSIQSVKLVVNSLLLDQYKASLPDIKGDFIVARISEDLTNPPLTYDNFGIEWGFIYMTQAEVIEYKAENNLI